MLLAGSRGTWAGAALAAGSISMQSLDDTGSEPADAPLNRADSLVWPVPGRSRGAGPPQRSGRCWLASPRKTTVLHSSSCSAQSLTPPCTQARGQRRAKVSRGKRFGDTGPRGAARTPGSLLCWLTPLPSSGTRPRPTSRATTVLTLENLFGAR